MSIGKIIGKINANLEMRSLLKQEKKVEKHFKLHGYDTYGDSYNKIYEAGSSIANYAANEGVRVDVYDAKKWAEAHRITVEPQTEHDIIDKVRVVVTNLRNKKTASGLVDADVYKLYPKYADRKVMIIPIKDEGTEIAVKPIWKTEDNFLRNLYRNIENLTKEVTDTKKTK